MFAMARDKQTLELGEVKKMVPGFSFGQVFLVFIFSCCCSAAEPQVPAFIVFGDSTCDVGMNSHRPSLAKSNFAPYGENFPGGRATGRFSDGQLLADMIDAFLVALATGTGNASALREIHLPHLHQLCDKEQPCMIPALKLGLPLNIAYLDPEATGERILLGLNFASAGAGFFQSTSTILNSIPAFDQLQLFYEYQMKMVSMVGRERASFITSESIFLLSLGVCDYLVNYLTNPLVPLQHTTTEWNSWVLSNQTRFLKELYEAGARKIVVYGFPPIGCLPGQLALARTTGQSTVGCVENLNQISIAYNKGLRLALSQLQLDLPGSRILYADSYTYLYEASNNPSKYGYVETKRGCCSLGEGIVTSNICSAAISNVCSDPSTYLFFDGAHPTQATYKGLAELLWSDMVPFFGLKR